MPEIEFSTLPQNTRVKLSEKGTKELWHRVNEFGGIKALSDSFDFSQSKMYNWKNKDLAMPVKFVRRIMGENSTREIILLKGKGSSLSIKNPSFPLKVSNELLTRIQESVKLNSEGTPLYITNEKVLIKRFTHLLEMMGNVEHTMYSRESRFELRYPAFLHNILSQIEFKPHIPALVDESGEIVDGNIRINQQIIDSQKIEDKLFSREKIFELALQNQDSDKIAKIIGEESDKAKKSFTY